MTKFYTYIRGYKEWGISQKKAQENMQTITLSRHTTSKEGADTVHPGKLIPNLTYYCH